VKFGGQLKKNNKDDFKVAWQEIQLLLEYH